MYFFFFTSLVINAKYFSKIFQRYILLYPVNSVAIAVSCDEEGASIVNDDCSISVCQQGHLEPYQGKVVNPNVECSNALNNCFQLLAFLYCRVSDILQFVANEV